MLAIPYDLEGGTQGATVAETTEMAGEWLRNELIAYLEHDEMPTAATYGNEPARGGRVAMIGVSATLSDVPSVTAAEAASRLGVSRARVSQMLGAGLLRGWKDGRNTRVSIKSAEARLAGKHTPGRPKKAVEPAMR